MDFNINLGNFSAINPQPQHFTWFIITTKPSHHPNISPIPSSHHSRLIFHSLTSPTCSGSMYPSSHGSSPQNMLQMTQTYMSQKAWTHGIYATAIWPINQEMRELQNDPFCLFSVLFIFLSNSCCSDLFHLPVATLGCQESHSDSFWLILTSKSPFRIPCAQTSIYSQ